MHDLKEHKEVIRQNQFNLFILKVVSNKFEFIIMIIIMQKHINHTRISFVGIFLVIGLSVSRSNFYEQTVICPIDIDINSS